MKKKAGLLKLALPLVLISLSACSGAPSGQGTKGTAKPEDTKPPAPPEPVTLTITNHKSVGFTEKDFQTYFV